MARKITTHKIAANAKMQWVHPNYNRYMLTVYSNTDGSWSCRVRNLNTKLTWILTGIQGELEAATDQAKAIADGNHGEASLIVGK